jgi:osmotically-inducible protein OsmY
MAQDEDRRWRERMQRDEDSRRYGSRDRYGEYGGETAGSGRRDWSSRAGSWADRDRSQDSESDWERTGWRDLERERGRGDDYSREFSRSFTARHQGYGGGGHSGAGRRQDRDYGGSMRAGNYGGDMGADRSDRYLGSRYGSGGGGGRSGMADQAFGGGYTASSGPDELERERDYGRSRRGADHGYGERRHGGRESGYGYGGPHEWGGRSGADERGFWDKATDEVSSWFGDEEAERRREMDRRHSGRGPRNYVRSDSRITEDLSDRLTEHPMVDASDIDVSVSNREVTLSGTVATRDEKRRAEDIAEAVSGVTHVQNNLRVKQRGESTTQNTLDSFANATSGAFAERGGSTMASRSGGTAAGSSTAGAGGSSATDAARTTTGSSPGVMRPDPSATSTKGA